MSQNNKNNNNIEAAFVAEDRAGFLMDDVLQPAAKRQMVSVTADKATRKPAIDDIHVNLKNNKNDQALFSRETPSPTTTQTRSALESARREPYVHPKPFSQLLDYKFIKTLGQGSMGKVKLAQHIRTDQLVAVKIVNRFPQEWSAVPRKRGEPVDPKYAHIPVKLDYDPSRELRLLREAFTMKLLNHPNIVKMIDFVVTEHHYYMIFEYAEGTQILDYIVANGRMREDMARHVVRQLLSGIDYCHKNSIVHRDLKIENIMIQKPNTADKESAANTKRHNLRRKSDGTEEGPVVRILDFGLSNYYEQNKLLSTFCGSLYFAAPELLQSQKYIGPAVDVWSLGVITYVLLTSTVPFDDQNWTVIHAKIRSGKCEFPPYMSSSVVKFIKRMLTVNPNLRASVEELKCHPWIQGIGETPTTPSDLLLARETPVLHHLGDKFRNMSFRRRSSIMESGSHRYSLGESSNRRESRFGVPFPIDPLVPKRVPLKDLPGTHPNSQIVALLKRDPFDACDIEHSTKVGLSRENGMPAIPASLWAEKAVKHLNLNEPATFGYGKGFGFDASEVDKILDTAMSSPLVLKNPAVSLYYLLWEWIQANGSQELVPKQSSSLPALSAQLTPSPRIVMNSVPQNMTEGGDAMILNPIQMTEKTVNSARGASRYLKGPWSDKPAKMLCQEFYDLMIEEGLRLTDSLLVPRQNMLNSNNVHTQFITEWTWRPSLILKSGPATSQSHRFVNFQVEWIQLLTEETKPGYCKYAMRCMQSGGDAEIFEKVMERITWRWSQWCSVYQ